MEIVAVDAGFGDVKLQTATRSKVFPAVYAPAGADVRTWGLGSAGHVVTVDGQAITYGEAALNSPARRTPGTDRRLSTPDALPLLGAALHEAGASGDITLATGLPLDSFFTEKDATEEFLRGRRVTLATGGEETAVRIAKVVLRPQGVAALVYALSLPQVARQVPSYHAYACLIDVGFRTTDVVTVTVPKVVPVRELSFSVQAGIGDVVETFRRSLASRFGVVPLEVARQALRESVGFKGQVLGPQDARQSVRDFAGRLRDELLGRFRGEVDKLVLAILAGGGATPLGGTLELPCKAHTLPGREARFANAKGYLKQAGGVHRVAS